MTVLRISQSVIEVVRRPTAPNAQISQSAIEVVLRPTAPNARISQTVIEVFHQNIAQALTLTATPLALSVGTPSAALLKASDLVETPTAINLGFPSAPFTINRFTLAASPLAVAVRSAFVRFYRPYVLSAAPLALSITGVAQITGKRLTLKALWTEFFLGAGDVIISGGTLADPSELYKSRDEGFKYVPVDPPKGASNDEVLSWALQELSKASNVINNLSEGRVAILHKAPDKPRDGMVRMADGTDWNPGGGRGYYGYDEASKTWIKIS